VAKPVAKKVVKPLTKKVVAKPAVKVAPKAVSKPESKVAPKKELKPTPSPKPAVVKVEATAPAAPTAPASDNAVESEKMQDDNPDVKPARAKANEKKEDKKESMTEVRYSDKDLKEFEELIHDKLKAAKSDMEELKQSLSHEGDNSTDDTAPTFKMMEDGSETMNREELSQLASRQEKFILNLENALLRIKNKTYGICRVTGKLIPKERLRLVPHATLSIEAKKMQ
jgi:RNA polymerase-binding transcription factor DksA